METAIDAVEMALGGPDTPCPHPQQCAGQPTARAIAMRELPQPKPLGKHYRIHGFMRSGDYPANRFVVGCKPWANNAIGNADSRIEPNSIPIGPSA